MEEEKKIRAFKCKTCFEWDDIQKKCKCVDKPEHTDVDSFGEVICVAHKNKQTGKPTGGYKELKPRAKVWFTSDWHFGHESILRFYPERRKHFGITDEEFATNPGECVVKMDKMLIEKWNKTVKKCDTVYYLGDFCLSNKEYTEKILQQLHGKKFLIWGNHDRSLKGLERYFVDCADIKEAKFTNNQFPFIPVDETFCVEMCHYPLLSWNRRNNGSCMVCGHSHGGTNHLNEMTKELRVDVGIDNPYWKYEMVELEELYNYFRNIIKSEDINTFREYIQFLIKKNDVNY